MKFTTRATVRMTLTARIRSWRAKDAPYLLEEIKSLYGLSTRFLLVRRLPSGNQYVVSRHRKRTAALKAAHRVSE